MIDASSEASWIEGSKGEEKKTWLVFGITQLLDSILKLDHQ